MESEHRSTRNGMSNNKTKVLQHTIDDVEPPRAAKRRKDARNRYSRWMRCKGLKWERQIRWTADTRQGEVRWSGTRTFSEGLVNGRLESAFCQARRSPKEHSADCGTFPRQRRGTCSSMRPTRRPEPFVNDEQDDAAWFE
jgi:hypothetical protein